MLQCFMIHSDIIISATATITGTTIITILIGLPGLPTILQPTIMDITTAITMVIITDITTTTRAPQEVEKMAETPAVPPQEGKRADVKAPALIPPAMAEVI